MATRDELYAKFGVTAEAAQLFETELGTLLLAANALELGWHVTPDAKKATQLMERIEAQTLGRLISALQDKVGIDDGLAERFKSALRARNRLNHGFYELHNLKIQSSEGRDEMMVDLEELHEELFQSWQFASAMTEAVAKLVQKMSSSGDR